MGVASVAVEYTDQKQVLLLSSQNPFLKKNFYFEKGIEIMPQNENI